MKKRNFIEPRKTPALIFFLMTLATLSGIWTSCSPRPRPLFPPEFSTSNSDSNNDDDLPPAPTLSTISYSPTPTVQPRKWKIEYSQKCTAGNQEKCKGANGFMINENGRFLIGANSRNAGFDGKLTSEEYLRLTEALKELEIPSNTDSFFDICLPNETNDSFLAIRFSSPSGELPDTPIVCTSPAPSPLTPSPANSLFPSSLPSPLPSLTPSPSLSPSSFASLTPSSAPSPIPSLRHSPVPFSTPSLFPSEVTFSRQPSFSSQNPVALRRAVQDLVEKYYPSPYPSSCLAAVAELRDLYAKYQKCENESDCAFFSDSLVPSSQPLLLDNCSYIKPFVVGNQDLKFYKNQAELLKKTAAAKEVCASFSSKPGCVGIFENRAIPPPICLNGRCTQAPDNTLGF